MSAAPVVLEAHGTLTPAAPSAAGGAFRPGDPGVLTLDVTLASGQLAWPTREALAEAFAGKLAVLDDGVAAPPKPADPALGSGTELAHTWHVQVLLPPGDQSVGPVSIPLAKAAGDTSDPGQAEIPAMHVHVVSALDAATAKGLDAAARDQPDALKEQVLSALAPPRGPWDVIGPGRWLLIAGLVLAALAAAVAAWLWARRGRKARPVPALPPEPAEVVARRRLSLLRAAGYLDRGEHRVYHVEISEILKEYLDARHGWDLRDRTTDEVRRFLAAERRKRPAVADIQGRVLETLGACDFVKFARHSPPRHDAEPLIDVVAALVEETTAVPHPQGTPAPPAVKGAA